MESEYDNVIHKQKEIIYEERKIVEESKNLKEYLLGMIAKSIDVSLNLYAPGNAHSAEWNYNGLLIWLKDKFLLKVSKDTVKLLGREELRSYLVQELIAFYYSKENAISPEKMQEIAKVATLRILDEKWRDHLVVMGLLRDGMQLRVYNQKDPLVEYQREASNMFISMVDSIRDDSLEYILKIAENER